MNAETSCQKVASFVKTWGSDSCIEMLVSGHYGHFTHFEIRSLRKPCSPLTRSMIGSSLGWWEIDRHRPAHKVAEPVSAT